MGNKSSSKINDIFPILLFLVFTLAALGVVLSSVKIYQQILRHSEKSYDTETAVSYLTEKFRSHDENGGITVGTFKGHDAVILRNVAKDVPYVTCIYAYDGYLRELYTEESALDGCSEADGTAILEMQGFSPALMSDGLIHLKFTDVSGSEMDTCLSVRSRAGQAGEVVE